MTIPTVTNRYGATVGGQFYKQSDLLRHWVCCKCGAPLAHTFKWNRERPGIDDVIKCVRCGGRDIELERGEHDE